MSHPWTARYCLSHLSHSLLGASPCSPERCHTLPTDLSALNAASKDTSGGEAPSSGDEASWHHTPVGYIHLAFP